MSEEMKETTRTDGPQYCYAIWFGLRRHQGGLIF